MQSCASRQAVENIFLARFSKRYSRRLFKCKFFLYPFFAIFTCCDDAFKISKFQQIIFISILFVDIVISYENKLDSHDFDLRSELDGRLALSLDYRKALYALDDDIEDSVSLFFLYCCYPDKLIARLDKLHNMFYDNNQYEIELFRHK